jgi:para-nitrobenzyl esterase
MLCAVLASVGASAATARSAPAPAAGVVHTEGGSVRGTVAGDYRTFQGIPYAAPPTGSLRWAPPAPAAHWDGIRNATKPGNDCPQSADLLGDPGSNTEDCLYLNVTTPTNVDGQRLPVLFWIHGGGFYFGSGTPYEAQRLATQGHAVVVTINYRLGALGYLAHPALDRTQAQPSGDYGMQDQQAALRWVHRNIAAFGGDAANVTVAGESAGAVSTCAQLVSPAAAGLFARVIVQSGPCSETNQWPHSDGYWFARPRATAERQGTALAASLGCAKTKDVVGCLRRVPAAKVLAASDGGGYGPAYGGGSVLPIGPEQALATGRFNRVPVIDGTTHDEHSTFIWAIETYSHQKYTPASDRKLLTDFFGPTATTRIMAQYPLSAYSSPSVQLSRLFTDYSWSCQAIKTDSQLKRYVPTYGYEFADENPPWGKGMPKADFPTGALHVGELQYLFNDTQFPGPQTTSQKLLSTQMVEYWTHFMRTGNPNGPKTATWNQFGSARDVQSLAPEPAGINPVDLGVEHRCGFWSTIRPLK